MGSPAGLYLQTDPSRIGDQVNVPGLTDQLAIPKAETPTFNPPPQQQLPVGAGFSGTQGAIANMAANFLHGWMEGRNIARDREERQAKNKLTSTYQAYQMAAAIAQNPDLPQEQRDAATQSMAGLKGAYLDLVRAYGGGSKPQKGGKGASGGGGGASMSMPTPGADTGAPQEGGGGEGGGIGGHAKHALGFLSKMMMGGGKPEYFQQGLADILENTMPSAPPAMSPQQKLARTNAQEGVDIHGMQDTLANLQKSRTDAVQSGAPPDQVAKIDQQIEATKNQIAAHTQPQQETLPGTREAQIGALQMSGEQLQNQRAALQKLQGGSSFAMLNPAEKIALGWNPNGQNGEFEAYLSQVGPEKQFKNEYEAAQQYQRDRRRLATAGRYQQQWDFVKDQEQSILDHLLQDPAMAKQYGLPRELREGESAPDWIVAQEAMKTMKGISEKPMNPTELARAKDAIVRQVLQQFPQFEDILSYKDAKGNVIVGLNPLGKPKTGFLGFGGESIAQFEQRRQGAMQALQQKASELGIQPDEMVRMGIGAPQGYVPSQGAPQSGGGMTAPPATGAPAGGPQAAPQSAPAPASAPGAPGAGNQAQQYRVTDPQGNSQVLPMTQAQLAAAKQKFPNAKIEPISAAGQAAQPSATTPAAKQPEASKEAPPQASPAAPAKTAAQPKTATPQASSARTPQERIQEIRQMDAGIADAATKQIRDVLDQARAKNITSEDAMKQVDNILFKAKQNAAGKNKRLAAEGEAEAQKQQGEFARHKKEQESQTQLRAIAGAMAQSRK
jgi:hypothetical protein